LFAGDCSQAAVFIGNTVLLVYTCQFNSAGISLRFPFFYYLFN
jgi:hypothetical protein